MADCLHLLEVPFQNQEGRAWVPYYLGKYINSCCSCTPSGAHEEEKIVEGKLYRQC